MKNYIHITISLLIAIPAFSQPRNIPDYVPKCGLVAWYPFSGNAIDSSGSRHNGMVNGAVLTTDRFGHSNSAYLFNGNSSYIIIPPDSANRDTTMDIDGSVSMSAWVRSTNYGNSQYAQVFWRGDAVSAHDPYSLYVDGSQIAFRKDVATGTTTNELGMPYAGIDASYHHIVATYDSVSGYMTLYFDGKFVNRINPPGLISYPTTTFWNMIGAVDNGNWQFFYGSIDDVGLWNRALTPCEVSNLYLAKNFCNCFNDSVSNNDTGNNTGNNNGNQTNTPYYVGVPSAFTPNGDGQNDILYVRGTGLKSIDLKIYDRFGHKVFETDNQNTGWDGTYKGKSQPIDVYAYVLIFTIPDGTTKVIKGNISLLR
jgi:gliding motility-associated-like protein